MKKEMLINVLQPEECRIAIIENGVLEELYLERTSHESYTGNIYKGRVVNLEPAIQAAFVDFSVGRNGFLHVSDVEPQYYDRHDAGRGRDHDDEPESRRRDRDRDRPERGRGRNGGSADESAPAPRAEDRDRGDRPRRPRRERPEQSIKGRRDRSERPSRSFGEGLDGGPAPEPAAEKPPRPAPAPEPTPEPEPTSWNDSSDIGWSRERPRDREFGAIEPREPAWGRSRSEPEPEPEREREHRPEPEPFDPDLPPSRTHRGRAPGRAEREREREPEREPDFFPRDERGRPRSLFGEPETPVEREREREPERERSFDRDEPAAEHEIEAETPPAGRREPRRGRGRGRSGRDAADRPVPPAEPEERRRPTSEFEPDEEPTRDFDDRDRDDEEPPRRRGRAAIRSRGGNRPEPDHPREREIIPAAEEPAPRPGRAAAERRAEPETTGERVRDRDRDRDRDRSKPHNRAGEPGYVPRRERLRASDLDFEDRPFEPTAELQRHAEFDDDDDRDRDHDAETELDETPTDEPRGKSRRRRRRGRRNGRDRDETESTTAPEAAEIDDRDAEFDEAPPRREPARPARRPTPRPHRDDFGGDLFDEVDHHDDDADEFDDAFHDEFDDEGAVATAVEEEIDPELEREIRREIEEIEELEREMGLRGPVEARPRRDDGKAGRGRSADRPPLQEIFHRGDEVLVQVIKESIGSKGPTLSTYISIPGRYLVLMPGLNRVGVSRKIVDEGQRRKLRDIMRELNPPKGLGFIVRTAGLERTKRELARDLAYLLRLWKVILKRIKKTKGPAPIYQESDMITRTIRDIFTSEIDTIWIDEPAAFERAQEFLRVVMPRFVNRVKLYDDKTPLFHKYGIEDEIAKIQRRHVPLSGGGSIVIDPTEALVAIDVNSGNFRVEDDAERTAYEMNLRAAKEIARQLRLRDLGGVIVNDFIDMREEKHRRGVERALRDAIKRDRARTKVLRMSAFGLIEMTRQRIRPSLKRSIYEDCQHCAGSGVVKTAESMAIDVMRLLALAAHRDEVRRVNITVGSAVATYLNNRKRQEITKIENEGGISALINFKYDVPAEHLEFECFDANGTEVRILPRPGQGQGGQTQSQGHPHGGRRGH